MNLGVAFKKACWENLSIVCGKFFGQTRTILIQKKMNRQIQIKFLAGWNRIGLNEQLCIFNLKNEIYLYQ